MAKIHDKFVIELAEVIKGYGNDPDVDDPFRLSTFYRFYELPNIAVSRENFETMRPVESEQRWIPITERLPEEETIYLITFGSGHVRLSSWHKDTKYNHGFDNIETGFLEDGTMVHFGVTAWMPLPTPYREGEQDG